MAKDPAERERRRQLHLHLPRNVTRTNYTSRELPERIRVPHIRAQTHTRAVFLSRTREGGRGKERGFFPATCNTLLCRACEGIATPIPLHVGGWGREGSSSFHPAGRFCRFDAPRPSKSSNRSFENQRDILSPSSLPLDPHDRRLPREDSFSRLGLQNPTRRGIYDWFRSALSPRPSMYDSTRRINRQSSFKYKSIFFLSSFFFRLYVTFGET